MITSGGVVAQPAGTDVTRSVADEYPAVSGCSVRATAPVDFIFKDEAFKFETLRAAGFAGDAGADIGEVIVTTAQIPEGDEDAWTTAWRSTAERIAQRGETSLEVGDHVSAREAFLKKTVTSIKSRHLSCYSKARTTRCSLGRPHTSRPNCGHLTNMSSCAARTVLAHTATRVRCTSCTRRSSTTLPRHSAD